MMKNFIYQYFMIASLLLLISCTNDSSVDERNIELPAHISNIENVIEITPQNQEPDTVVLTREVVFESNMDVFINGYITRLAVDEDDRVYIGATRMGHAAVYAFDPDGNFITEIGGYGRGPGEFQSIRSLEIVNNRLYLFCSILHKVSMFDLDDFSHIRDRLIKWGEVNEADSIARRLNFDQLLVTHDDNLIIRLQALALFRETDKRAVYYRRVSDEGVISPDNLLEKKRFKLYFHVNEGRDVPFPMPFTRSSLVSITKEGHFLTNWTEDFLIKVYDDDGNYERAFYYQLENPALSLNDFDLSRDRQRALDQYELPENWPVIHTMELDNEDRLWVSTITESDSTFQWYVLDQQKEVLARFQRPGTRRSRRVMSNPLLFIQNGYFYTREVNYQQGISRIVKYKIEFKPRQ